MDEEDLKRDIESPLMGDDNTPFSVPQDNKDDIEDPIDRELEKEIDLTHPVLDTKPDATELYQEGVNGATEASEPNEGSSVTDYETEDTP